MNSRKCTCLDVDAVAAVVVAALERLALDGLEVLADHLLDEVEEVDPWLPAELGLGLLGVAQQEVDLGGTEVLGIDADEDALGVLGVDADLLDGALLAAPLDGDAGLLEGELTELTDGVTLASGEHVVVGLVLLEDAPHALHVVAGVAPVADGVEVAEVEAVVYAHLDADDGARNLPGDEGVAAARGLVVKEDAVGDVHVVGLAVVDHDPVGVLLGDAVGRAGIEGRELALGDLAHLAEELGGGGLVEAAGLLEAAGADGVQQAQRADSVDLGGVLGEVEGDLDVGLGAEVVDLVGADLGDDVAEVGAVGEVAVVQEQRHVLAVGVAVEVVDTAGVEGGRAADDAVDLVALGKEELGEVGTILAGDTGDEGDPLGAGGGAEVGRDGHGKKKRNKKKRSL